MNDEVKQANDLHVPKRDCPTCGITIVDRIAALEAENKRLCAALEGLSVKLNTISTRANTYGPGFPPTYSDALWKLANEAREALKGE